ncbi:MAG: hypothetical protein ACRBHB_06350 [Arenicella sp.]
MREELAGYIKGLCQFSADYGFWIDLKYFELTNDVDLQNVVIDKLTHEGWQDSEVPKLSHMNNQEFKHSVDSVFKLAIRPPVGKFTLTESFFEFYRCEYGKLEFFGSIVKEEEDVCFVYVTQIPGERVLYILRCGFGQ